MKTPVYDTVVAVVTALCVAGIIALIAVIAKAETFASRDCAVGAAIVAIVGYAVPAIMGGIHSGKKAKTAQLKAAVKESKDDKEGSGKKPSTEEKPLKSE